MIDHLIPIKRGGKSLAHILKMYEHLKANEKVILITHNINHYCELFQMTTQEKLFYKELKNEHYHIELNPI